MDLQHYWTNKHFRYKNEDWINKPSIFATQALSYFPKSGNLLDLGCGQGQDSIFFAQNGYQVTGVDFAQFALQQARYKTPQDLKAKVKFELIDLTRPLPFAPASFDVVYSHMSLHFFSTARTTKLFDEIYNILTPNGIFATIVNTKDDSEVKLSKKLEGDLYLAPDGLQKRHFSIHSMSSFTNKFKRLLLDNHGETYKDTTRSLIRFVGTKA